jgi:hypothetical protein
MVMPTVLTEGKYLNDWLKWEMENNQSREVVTVLAGQKLAMGAVVGKITVGAVPTTGTAGTNTGGGTCASVTGGPATKVGVYELTCVAVVSGGGVFSVKDPDGLGLPNAYVGQAYTNPAINFTLTDGTPDFALGDVFRIVVPAGSGKVKGLDFGAIDGSADAYGVMVSGVDGMDNMDRKGVAIVRNAQIVSDYLSWPSGTTDEQKATALLQLSNKGTVTRTDV